MTIAPMETKHDSDLCRRARSLLQAMAFTAFSALAGCASDAALTTSSDARAAPCVRRTGSNVCEKHKSQPDAVSGYSREALEDVRDAAPPLPGSSRRH